MANQAVCDALSVVHQLQPETAPGAVELLLVETSGKIAGTFRITTTMATELTTGTITVKNFFVKHLIVD